MKNVLSFYIDTSEPAEGEWQRLLAEIRVKIQHTLTEEELDAVEEWRVQQKGKKMSLVTLDVFSEVLGLSVERISDISGGRGTPSPTHMRLLRVLHHRVVERPDLARTAIRDSLIREGFLSPSS